MTPAPTWSRPNANRFLVLWHTRTTLVLASSAAWAHSRSRRPAVGRGHPLFNLFSWPGPLRIPGRILARARSCAAKWLTASGTAADLADTKQGRATLGRTNRSLTRHH